MIVEWDPLKARLNEVKHAVGFIEALSVLESNVQLVLEDRRHDEQRFIAIGLSNNARLVVVVYSYPNPDVMRIISARKATKAEGEMYEKRI